MKPATIFSISVAVSVTFALWLIRSSGNDSVAKPVPAASGSLATSAPVRQPGAILPAQGEGFSPRAAKPGEDVSPSAFSPTASLGSPSQATSPTEAPLSFASAPLESTSQLEADPDALPPLTVRADAPPIPGRAVDPAAPGNFIRFRGVRVAVAGSYESGKPGDRALALDVSPETANEDFADEGSGSSSADLAEGTLPPGAGTSEDPATGEAQDSARPSPDGPAPRYGLTREEQLFRMKWGWAAYDAAQREALKEVGKQ